jgi:hypothetical protein
MPNKPIRQILEKLAKLESQALLLRQEVAEIEGAPEPDDLLEHLSEPLSFQQIMIRSGIDASELRARLTDLYVSGQIERWDLPRFVRSDLGANEKKALLRQILSETPVRQKGGESLTGLTRGQVSGVLIELQKEGGLARLGPTKGDPWFLARGTQPPPAGQEGTARAEPPEPSRRRKRSR